jgi:two-component system catabolic regulation response regulator CreB
MNQKPTILIVDDEPSIADALTYALSTEGLHAEWCGTGAAALANIQASPPVLVVLDVGLPDMTGFDVCRGIRASTNTPILFLSARAEEVDRILGLELGGDDYISKPFSPREVVARIKAILRRTEAGRGMAPLPVPKRNPDFRIDEERMRVLFKERPLELTRYEFRLLCVLVRRPGRVYSREDLMNIAWESPEMSLERTVDTHIKTIRAKLHAIDPETEFIITHRGLGYSLREG